MVNEIIIKGYSNNQIADVLMHQRKAFDLWSYAALRGQIDAQVKVADTNAKGLGVVLRNPELAAMYLRVFKHVI